jgi:chorismate-pyruvate lyase
VRHRFTGGVSADSRRLIDARDLHAALVGCDSATAVLERFFGAPVTAERVRETSEAADGARRLLFCLGAEEGLRHRRSRLCANGEVLVVADLWYVPARLPGARVLDLVTTTAPFGRVMQGLGLQRRLLDSRFGAAGARVALHHHAMLLDRDGIPVAEVVERYCAWALRRK